MTSIRSRWNGSRLSNRNKFRRLQFLENSVGSLKVLILSFRFSYIRLTWAIVLRCTKLPTFMADNIEAYFCIDTKMSKNTNDHVPLTRFYLISLSDIIKIRCRLRLSSASVRQNIKQILLGSRQSDGMSLVRLDVSECSKTHLFLVLCETRQIWPSVMCRSSFAKICVYFFYSSMCVDYIIRYDCIRI